VNKTALKIITVLSVFVISLLVCIFILKSVETECNRIHLDDDLRLWGTHDAVPDKETAIKLAEIALHAQSLGPHSDINYKIEVTFYEEYNLWVVLYNPGAMAGGGRVVAIRKDCGMISGMAYL